MLSIFSRLQVKTRKGFRRPQNWPARPSRDTALTKGPAVNSKTEIDLCTQLGLSDLVPHFRQIHSGGDSDRTSRTTSIFWGEPEPVKRVGGLFVRQRQGESSVVGRFE